MSIRRYWTTYRYLSISKIVDIMMPIMARSKTTTLDPDVRLLAALADPTRLAIVRQLASEAETCACDFTSTCDVGQPTVSHHLRVLRDAGVVVGERRGSWVFYRLAPDVAERLGSIARELVPGGLIPVADLVARRPRTSAASEVTRPA
jgi:ArsR family transcriptional regulator